MRGRKDIAALANHKLGFIENNIALYFGNIESQRLDNLHSYYANTYMTLFSYYRKFGLTVDESINESYRGINDLIRLHSSFSIEKPSIN